MVKKIFGALARFFYKLDKPLLIAVCSVSAFSVLLMYSIVANGITAKTSSMYKMQFLCLIIGAAAAVAMSLFDYHKFAKLWFLYAPLAIGFTCLTFTSLGYRPVEGVDDKAWINLGFMTMQPSEILKIAFILTFAFHLSKVKENVNNFLNVLLLCLHAAIPVGIVALQGDDGTAIIFAVIFVFMIFSAGISWKYILPCVIALPAGVWLLWEKIMQPHQKLRFMVLFTPNPENDPSLADIYYQQYRGKLALGSGQLFGKGLFADSYVNVPEVQNDFILTYVAQCLGFIGCIALVAVLAYICLKILADSSLQRTSWGGLYALACLR